MKIKDKKLSSLLMILTTSKYSISDKYYNSLLDFTIINKEKE